MKEKRTVNVFFTTCTRALFCALSLLVLIGPTSCSKESSGEKRVIVVAIDGMDYKLVRKWLNEGSMPNFEALEKEGGFRQMGTSIPPESPVAWANFITGQNPGGHGIFDFLHHEWSEGTEKGEASLIPLDPITGTEPVGLVLPLFGYEFPLTGGGQINKRRGTAFWELLEDADVPATIYKIPSHFPPTETGQKTLSGMGTPDLQGGYGTYFLYTEDQFSIPGKVERGELITNTVYDNVFHDYLYGPVDPLVKAGEPAQKLKIPFWVYLDPEKPIASIVIGDEENSDTTVVLKEGEWSDYVEVDFDVVPHVTGVSGILRFNLLEARPNFRLFVDPINVSPKSPAIDITTPSGWAAELAEKNGLFDTKGMPENTAALKDGILTYDEYRAHSMLIYEKRKEMFFNLFEDQKEGFLFYYFCSIDLDSHMYWRHMDDKHPSHDPSTSEFNKNFIRWLYEDIDAFVGRIREKIGPNDTLVVMSDHGFAPYYRDINLNTWLLQKGYMKLKEGVDEKSLAGLDFNDVDWRNSRAYSVGFCSICINIKGDCPCGTVAPSEVDSLVNEICARLMKERDDKNGKPIFRTMYKTREIYTGDVVQDAPHIIVGCYSGYGASDKSAMGEFTDAFINDNMSPWSGSHLMAAEEVPGIILTNRRFTVNDPKLYDLTATILNDFDVKKTDAMIGRPIW
jgi:predicted AlkP superfamily phosphohydrolase/phosphomutase